VSLLKGTRRGASVTDDELFWLIIEQEFPDYRKALEIHNPFGEPLWDENLELSEKEKLYYQYVDQYNAILKRYDQLCDSSEERKEALRKEHGLSSTEVLSFQQKKDRVKDDIIGITAEQLIRWGFPRRKVYKELTDPSASILKRVAPEGGPLSKHRIEQIHEEWRVREKKYNIERIGCHISFQRWLYTTRSLVERGPDVPLNELIIKLLENKGTWPHKVPEGYIQEDLEHSKRARILMFLFPRPKGNGEK